jgi:hypothetical protein
MSSKISCPRCRKLLPDDFFNDVESRCPGCLSHLSIEVFPAFFRKSDPVQNNETVLLDGEATCFYHTTKKALLPCHGCGRFLCALCDCEFNGDHFCPACLETGKTKGKIKNLEDKRTLYDSIALGLAVLPVVTIVFWFFTLITAPMAMFVAIRYWNAPRSIIRRTKLRYVLAITFASVEIASWGLVFYFGLRRVYG